MVASATSLGRSGLHDWIIQRVTAVVLAAYVIYLTAFIVSSGSLSFPIWQALFSQLWFKIFSLLAVASICFHAWIGMWIITTDYVKPTGIRMVVQVLIILACFAFLIWGAQILWSV